MLPTALFIVNQISSEPSLFYCTTTSLYTDCSNNLCLVFQSVPLDTTSIFSTEICSTCLYSNLNFSIARQQACIQIAAAIYTQARLRTSLFCFLLYQLSLWWVKYRAQPEAISTWNHASRNAPWQAETGWGEKVKPRKPAWNQAFLWLPILYL